MSALEANLKTTKFSEQPNMEAVVVNSIIYSKPSFCTIAIYLGNVTNNKFATSSKFKSGNAPKNRMLQNNVSVKNTFWTTLSISPPPADAKVYKMCTTINGSIQHQISEFCDDILAIGGHFGVAKSDDVNESLFDLGYTDDHGLGVGNYSDDDDEDDEDDNDSESEELNENDNDDDDDDDVIFAYEDEGDCKSNKVNENDNSEDVYDNDVVDFAYECSVKPVQELICDKKKKVRFNTIPPTVHIIRTWNYAYRSARKGEWEVYARDRERFKLRIHRAGLFLNPILKKEHRNQIYKLRFENLEISEEEHIVRRQTNPTETQQANHHSSDESKI